MLYFSEESCTIVAPPPDGSGLTPGQLYSYETFPAIDSRYLKKKRQKQRDSKAVEEAPDHTVHQRSATEKQKGGEILTQVTPKDEMWAK